ncbi:NIPSNAP family protein [Ochrobactrum sp. Q0168]|uniref:NIPSNAP family protein n=1 Tax=Ochrobactrum sp. Q0168 TaxID=2793241 RepID=UPI0018EDD4BC|nr:NIPSNAP family protein [Ochrobactrum sp. Q0168]
MAENDNHIYELRLYAIAPGRLNDMAARFRNDIRVLFPKHGIRLVGSWTCIAGPRAPVFVYLMRWDSFEQRSQAFASFAADPDWQEARARTNGPSELVERYEIQFLKALDGSGIEEPMPLTDDGVFELNIHAASNGRAVAMRDAILNHDLAAKERAGADLVGAFEAITGPKLPSVISLVRWPDANTLSKGYDLVESDQGYGQHLRTEINDNGRHVLGDADRFVMRPVAINWN